MHAGKPLNGRQHAVVLHYVANPWNKTQSYRRIYRNASYAAARACASRLFKQPNVRQFMREFYRKANEQWDRKAQAERERQHAADQAEFFRRLR